MKPLIYIAVPYSHKDRNILKERLIKVSAFAGMLIKAGNLVYSPISQTALMSEYANIPSEYEVWKELDRFFIEHSDIMFVLMLDGWEVSIGVTDEIAIATQSGKPIIYIPPSFAEVYAIDPIEEIKKEGYKVGNAHIPVDDEEQKVDPIHPDYVSPKTRKQNWEF